MSIKTAIHKLNREDRLIHVKNSIVRNLMENLKALNPGEVFETFEEDLYDELFVWAESLDLEVRPGNDRTAAYFSFK